MEEARTNVPSSTEDVAQGDDIVMLEYKYQPQQSGHLSRPAESGKHGVTWNQIIAAISPYLLEEASETSMRRLLANLVASESGIEKKYQAAFDKSSFHVHDNDFQTVKIQLRALGIIEPSNKQKTIKVIEPYWMLSPHGDNVMTKLRAVKKTYSSLMA